METENLPLSQIQSLYENTTDKKLSIKQIKEQLEDKSYKVVKVKGYYFLKFYKLIGEDGKEDEDETKL